MKRALPIAALLLTAACGNRPVPGDPPRISIGRDACARCGMIVSEARFAAGFVDAEGVSVAFDDVGELLAAASEDASLITDAFAADAEDGGMVSAGSAFFVRVPSLATPMGTGVAAFRDRTRALAFSRERGGGAVLDWMSARQMAQRQSQVPGAAHGVR